jgi:hypothetical protein
MKTNYLYFLLAIALISCKKEACPADWLMFESTQFNVCYPSNWEPNDNGLMGSELVLIDMNNAADLGFGRNVNIIKQHQSYFPQLKNLDDYASFSKDQMSDYLEGVEIIAFEKSKIGALDTYKSVMRPNQNGRELYFVQHYFIHGDHYFVATFTTTNDDTPEHKKAGEQILGTIKMR